MPERVISGNTFSVEPLTAMRSFALQPRIAPAIAAVAEAVGSLTSISGKGDLGTVEVAALAPAVGRFFQALQPGDLQDITRALLGSARMDGIALFSGAGDPFELKMRGRTLDTWRLLWFALEVNYPDFFGLLAGAAARQPAPAPSEESST